MYIWEFSPPFIDLHTYVCIPGVIKKSATFYPGVNVMITIFCDFRQFSAKKWSFSQKPLLWSKFCIIQLCFESQTLIFAKFLAKIFKNPNIGTRSQKTVFVRYEAKEIVRKCRSRWHRQLFYVWKLIPPPLPFKLTLKGFLLQIWGRSQFSAIFTNFWWKKWRFDDQFFAKTSNSLNKNANFFSTNMF
jgi:hypothetical protein